MSSLLEFHIGLHSCNLSSQTRKVFNPFTGEELIVPCDGGLDACEVAEVLKVFSDESITEIHEHDDSPGYFVYANDWISLRCYKLGGEQSVEDFDTFVTVSELSERHLNVILRLARSGNLALMSQLDRHVRVVDRVPSDMEIARWPDAKKLVGSTELRAWLNNEIKGELVEIRSN